MPSAPDNPSVGCAAPAAHRYVEPNKSVQRSTPPIFVGVGEAASRNHPMLDRSVRLDAWSSAAVVFARYRVAVSSTFNAPVSAALPKTS